MVSRNTTGLFWDTNTYTVESCRQPSFMWQYKHLLRCGWSSAVTFTRNSVRTEPGAPFSRWSVESSSLFLFSVPGRWCVRCPCFTLLFLRHLLVGVIQECNMPPNCIKFSQLEAKSINLWFGSSERQTVFQTHYIKIIFLQQSLHVQSLSISNVISEPGKRNHCYLKSFFPRANKICDCK